MTPLCILFSAGMWSDAQNSPGPLLKIPVKVAAISLLAVLLPFCDISTTSVLAGPLPKNAPKQFTILERRKKHVLPPSRQHTLRLTLGPLFPLRWTLKQ